MTVLLVGSSLDRQHRAFGMQCLPLPCRHVEDNPRTFCILVLELGYYVVGTGVGVVLVT